MKNLCIFGVGAVSGSLLTWYIVKKKYERIADEEIALVTQRFKQINENTKNNDDADTVDCKKPDHPDLFEYKSIVQSQKYNAISEPCTVDIDDKMKEIKNPYIIKEDDLGNKQGYEVEYLNYYADGVLVTEFDEPIDDLTQLVGGCLSSVKGDEGVMCIRNDTKKTDYEITIMVCGYNQIS